MVGAWYTSHPGDSAMWPVTSAIAPNVTDGVFIFIVLLATLYGGELVWRERQLKVDQLQDAMPVPVVGDVRRQSSSRSFSRSSCCSSSTTLGGMIMQVAQGYTRLQPALYAQIVGFIALPIGARDRRARDGRARDREPEVRRTPRSSSPTGSLVPVLSNIGLDHRIYQVGRPADFTVFRHGRMGSVSSANPHVRVLLGRGLPGDRDARLPRAGARHGGRMGARAGARRARGGGTAGRSPSASLGRRRRRARAESSSTTPTSLNAYTEVRTAERRVKGFETTYKPLAVAAATATHRRVAAPRLLPGATRRRVARHAARGQPECAARRHAVHLAAAPPARHRRVSSRPRRAQDSTSTRSCSIATRR